MSKGDLRLPCQNDEAELCEFCGNILSAAKLRRRARFCDKKCCRLNEQREFRRRNGTTGLSSGKAGAVQELLVCADLLRLGYDVFRSVSPHSSCDIVIVKEGLFLRVEVTTGHLNKNGEIRYPHHKPNNYDIIAIVTKGAISYVGLT